MPPAASGSWPRGHVEVQTVHQRDRDHLVAGSGGRPNANTPRRLAVVVQVRELRGRDDGVLGALSVTRHHRRLQCPRCQGALAALMERPSVAVKHCLQLGLRAVFEP
jgi:hypothetical protein